MMWPAASFMKATLRGRRGMTRPLTARLHHCTSCPARVQNAAGPGASVGGSSPAMRPRALAPSALLILVGCTTQATPENQPLTACAAGLELFRGACVEPARRYEPGKAIDQDNVVAYGDSLTELKLPPPPKSGFRIIAPPRIMAPGAEDDFCLSWPFPAIKN